MHARPIQGDMTWAFGEVFDMWETLGGDLRHLITQQGDYH